MTSIDRATVCGETALRSRHNRHSGRTTRTQSPEMRDRAAALCLRLAIVASATSRARSMNVCDISGGRDYATETGALIAALVLLGAGYASAQETISGQAHW
jgi:hypothetical protein